MNWPGANFAYETVAIATAFAPVTRTISIQAK
jgi:hypothetical protein